ncbi:MFS general substrate transporter [Schizopora paradoxa]|uniref:MFS general substrate transporter n=1 Tax=Schizopora paradoxa TaxID=27342 RepID=A0A0H2SAP7_9AGAM|nr:MFS general substrate transporter [Schizopora paradoxa]
MSAVGHDALAIDEKKLMRKIDYRIIPWLSLLYLLSYLDRSTIGNARLYHMEADLHVTDSQYLVALSTFFITYSLLEFASNAIMKRLSPSLWLTFLITMWGVVTLLHGFVRNYGQLVACRVILGVFEAGLAPGMAYYLSSWYKKSELGTRVAIYCTAATLAGAIGGLLAAGISRMNGVAGKPAWAWIFIIEGGFTILIGIVSFWVLQDFPVSAKFLTEDERQFVIQRLQRDQQFSAAGEKFEMRFLKQAVMDKKTWISMGIFMGCDGPLYAFLMFAPTIINEVSGIILSDPKGFTANMANLLSVPVYAWATIMTLVVGVFGDRYIQRSYLNMFRAYLILTMSRTAGVSYFACYLAAGAIYPLIRDAWVSSNNEGSLKRGSVLGLCIGWGNLQGAVTSNVYRAKDSPWYSLGHGIILIYISIALVFTALYRAVLNAENMRRARGERDEIIVLHEIRSIEERSAHVARGAENTFESVDEARREKGDNWSGFRYSL